MKTVTKPWGKEEWLELNDQYCYKRIYINAGYKTSYQYHNFKKETNYIISGQAEVWLENDEGVVEKKIMYAGEYFNVTPPKKHRVIAITDIILQEVSTPEVDDVFRIDDEFHRADGKIDGEHKTPAVLILCAGLGTRLEKLTKNINKTLLPINNRAIISHIIEKFPIEYEFIITKGYKGDSIEEYCKLSFPNHKFTFVEIDKYEGDGTGPGYSTLKCKEYLQRPFYFVTGDCIIDSPLPHIDGNWLGVSPTSFPEKYSTIKIDNSDNIITHNNKDINGFDLAFIGMGGILNYEIFWNELEKNMINGEIVSAFKVPINYPTLKVKRLKWLDTGNLDDLTKTREYFNDVPMSLHKDNGEITYNVPGYFIKFIPNRESLRNRVTRAWYLKDLIPTKFGHKDNFIHYKWVTGKTLYENDNLDLFIKFLDTFSKNLKTSAPNSVEDIKLFYFDKTIDRFNLFISKHNDSYLTSEHEINGIKYKSMDKLFTNLYFGGLSDNPFYMSFHGDLQFDNVIYDEINDKFVYIDWRESFGTRDDAGDVYYDLAKLYGGLLIPYNLMKDENKITFNEGEYSVSYSYPISESLIKFKKIYEKWITQNGFDLNKIKFITGLIYLNMSPLHDGKFGKMLWFKSIEILSNVD